MNIGDKVVYPMHGAGEITGIEEQEVGGVTQSYYILRLPMGSMKLMLPVDKIEEIGLRDIIDKSRLEELKEVLSGESDMAQGSWNKRFHLTLDRLKTGDVLEVAAVVRNLTRQNLKKKIPSGERRLMDLSRQILISELVYVLDKNPDEVTDWVDKIIGTDENISETENVEETE
ncbi:MAG: CarD family transcriptional regulator [Selenomonadaceae bacterium]|nr:CarD family transcriptional regulator [Selenomonadaceae bacterium]